MSKFIENKKNLVNELSGLFSDHESFLIFEFSTLDCEYLTNLKQQLRKLNSKILIRKNNIINRALENANVSKETLKLSGPNAILFGGAEIAPLQTIAKLSKNIKEMKLKVAYFDKNLLIGDSLKEIVNLKTKDETIAIFANLLLNPLYKLTYLLKNIKI